MRFSQRIGLRPIKSIIQKDSMDQDLRVGLWNAFQLVVLDKVDGCSWIHQTPYKIFFEYYGLAFLSIHWTLLMIIGKLPENIFVNSILKQSGMKYMTLLNLSLRIF